MSDRRKTRACFVAALAVSALAALAYASEPLANRLPQSATVVYAQADLGRILTDLDAYARFLDAESADRIRREAEELVGIARETAARHEFAPALLDHLDEVVLSLVIMAKAEPTVVTHTYSVPKFDMETGEFIEGEMEEHSYTEKSEYTMSLLARVPSEEMAKDFLDQVKQAWEREMEREPDAPRYRLLEVDRGEMLASEDDDDRTTLGWLGEYLVLSNDRPDELWAALMAPPEDSVSRAAAHQRLTGRAEGAPQFLAMANLQTLVAKLEQGRRDAVAEAQRKVDAGEGGDDFFGPQMELQMAQQFLSIYETFDRLFSLSKLEWVGAGLNVSATERAASQRAHMLLSFDQPLSPIMEGLLTGPGRFEPPPAFQEGSMTVLARLDLQHIYDQTIAELRASQPEAMGFFDMQMQAMKMEVGADVSDLLGILGSDIYASVNMTRKEVEETSWDFDPETEEFKMTTTKTEKAVPDVTILWGARDPGAARATLSDVFARLAASPEYSEIARKRTFQEQDIYCFGMGVAEPESYPDGMTSMALAVLGRHLAIGSWERVTDAVRHSAFGRQQPDPHVMAAVQQHPEANLLIVIPKEFEAAMQEAMEEDETAFETLLKLVDELPWQGADPEMDRRMKESMRRLIQALQAMTQRASAQAPDVTVFHGTRRGSFYEVLSETEIRR